MSSSAEYTSLFSVPIAALQYPDIAGLQIRNDAPPPPDEDGAPQKEGRRRAEVELTEVEFAARIRQERADSAQQTEQRLRQECEQKLIATREPVTKTIREFAEQRDSYFARLEMEVVQLSLSIAAKILHREAQVDPMLVATLVRLSIEKMQDESSVTVRVSPGRGASWKQYCTEAGSLTKVQIVEDPTLTEHDCVLETELGSANFGLDSQLKEVEQGFFDLLALRPASR